ncbi:MAG: helix-turn-helix transcriptional regulator [Burkholderiaceae bacterium]|nr:helix-turn-helix transcriptional regulator [Burkholderiaceae bacterium]
MLFLAHDKLSLSLTAAVKALGFPDLVAKDRARLYTTIAICFHQLIDFPSGRQVMEEYAWPEAERSNDPQTIVALSSRCVGMLHSYACWSADIPCVSTVGAEKVKLPPPAELVARARRYLAICDSYLARVPASDRSWALGQKGLLLSLAEGWPRARAIFDEALAYAANFPRERVAALTSAGVAARIAKEWQLARSYFEQAKALPAAQCAYNQRVLAYELSLVYQALGDFESALAEMRSFSHLQTQKVRLATQWTSDPSSKRRYGEGFDLSTVKGLVFERLQPAVLKRAVAYVETNLDKRLMLSDVARQSSVSTRTLQNLFKVHHGVAVSEFIRERRMQRANDMLIQGRLSVSEISGRIGYSRLANFSRDYRRRFGRTPSSVLDASVGARRRYDQYRIEDPIRSAQANGHYRNGSAS